MNKFEVVPQLLMGKWLVRMNENSNKNPLKCGHIFFYAVPWSIEFKKRKKEREALGTGLLNQ